MFFLWFVYVPWSFLQIVVLVILGKNVKNKKDSNIKSLSFNITTCSALFVRLLSV